MMDNNNGMDRTHQESALALLMRLVTRYVVSSFHCDAGALAPLQLVFLFCQLSLP